jgi:hypothetical protein
MRQERLKRNTESLQVVLAFHRALMKFMRNIVQTENFSAYRVARHRPILNLIQFPAAVISTSAYTSTCVTYRALINSLTVAWPSKSFLFPSFITP